MKLINNKNGTFISEANGLLKIYEQVKQEIEEGKKQRIELDEQVKIQDIQLNELKELEYALIVLLKPKDLMDANKSNFKIQK